MGCAIFVTGTDTGVGKTIVSAGLTLALRKRGIDVGVMKPAVTGCRSVRGKRLSDDVEYLVGAGGCTDDRDQIAPYMLRDPLAPEVAAGREGIRIDVRRIVRAFKKLQKEHEILIVEGAGGLFVPIKRKYFMIDLVAALAAPLVIVSRPGLGTINHTLLTCEAARTRSVDIVGIVINNYPAKASVAARTNPGIIRRYSGAALLGIMPRLPGVSVEKRKYEGLLEATEKNIDIPMILRKLRKNR